MNNKYLQNPLIIVSFLIIIISTVPYLFLQTNAYLTIHDNLDGEFVYYHILKLNDLLFSFDNETIVPNIMNGLPRSFFHSEFSFVRLLFYILPSFWAYVVNLIIIRVIGFVGMYLLLKNHLLKDQNILLQVWLSIMFALIPVFPLYGLSVSGQALLLWAFLNLNKNKHNLYSFLIIILFPFYSHFALIAPFILASIVIVGIYINGKKLLKSKFFIGITILFLSYITANFFTITNFIFNKYISHRTDWIPEIPTIKNSIISFLTIIVKNHYHSASFYAIPIYILALTAIYKLRGDKKKRKDLLLLFFFIVSIAFFYAIYPFLKFYLGDKFHIIISFQFNRFIFLIPFLWFVILSISIANVENNISKPILYSILLVQSILILKTNKELIFNYSKLIFGNNNEKININALGYKHYYAENLFLKIDSIIAKPKKDYRVVSIGIQPSIAQYNGFYTLDSYQNNYLLSYKQEFQKIIAPELNKNKILKNYFVNWGSRCYLFSSELKSKCYLDCRKNQSYSINIDINSIALKELGAKYIFSAVVIENYKEINLEFVKTITDDNSLWNINLYKVN